MRQVHIVRRVEDLRAAVAEVRTRQAKIGFVPTLGALHEGHGRLIDTARSGTDFVVVSIFVNPLQFGPAEDFDRYPRPFEADVAFCEARGVDLIFAPPVEEMYPQEQLITVDPGPLAEGLCGASRPVHFRGVATVVSKLLNMVQPDIAYFGQKDAQQALIIRRLAKDLAFPVDIEVCPTVRESDGLAMSSRNRYLSADQRSKATVLYRALLAAQSEANMGELEGPALRRVIVHHLESEPAVRIDYVEVVDTEQLKPIGRLENVALAAAAIYLGDTRLIDNVIIRARPGSAE